MADARFEDGAERALALRAETAEDLPVISALVQDCVLPVTEIRYDRARRQLALLVNRFRWEDRAAAEAEGRAYERVQSLLVVSEVLAVRSQGVDRAEKDLVLSILDLVWTPAEDGAGELVLTLAGDGAIAVSVEALAVDLRDVTKPYKAVSGKVPQHRDDGM
ncbi:MULTISPECIES: DUF2948 family protein [Thioclava]|uniref:DUF2948 family protein n=1 Tax=Thioclava litoralis TaxID=3076557 RepID=A0ABZ1DXF9_9RHOB|nr:DUF2948 family protein [Thioclava sp. FTW29]